MNLEETVNNLVKQVTALTIMVEEGGKKEGAKDSPAAPKAETKYELHSLDGALIDNLKLFPELDDEINEQWGKLEKYAKALSIDYIPYEEVLNTSSLKDSADLIEIAGRQVDFTRNIIDRLDYLISFLDESM